MMTETVTELPQNLKDALLPGETVLWSGKSEPFSLKNDTPAVKQWILYTAVFAAGSVVSAVAEKLAGAGFNTVWQIALTVVWAFYMIRPLLDANKVRKSVYAVTDRRVIVLPGGESAIIGLNRKGLRRKITDSLPGNLDVLLGASVDIPAKDHYKRTYFPVGTGNSAGPNGVVFYNVKDDSALRSLLAE